MLECSTLVELTVATEETAVVTPAPLATESPAPAPTQTNLYAPAPTEIHILEPTAAPTEAPATESAVTASQPEQVSMSYGAVPFDLAAGSEEWWSIDSSDSADWVCNKTSMRRAAAGASFDDGQWPSAAADWHAVSFVAGWAVRPQRHDDPQRDLRRRSDWLGQQRLHLLAGQPCPLCQYYGAQLHQHGRGLLVLQHSRRPVHRTVTFQ